MTAIPEQTLIFLHSGQFDIHSHQVRIILQEKEAPHEIKLEDLEEPSEDFLALSPYQMLPVLTDRELVLFDTRSIMEYLDERFPYPPLMPVDPESRAKIRQMLMRIDKDWISKAIEIRVASTKRANVLRKELKDSLSMLSVIFSQHEFFMNDEFTLLDCALAPLLWQLKDLGIELPESAEPVHEYAARLFERETFQASLTEYEEEMALI